MLRGQLALAQHRPDDALAELARVPDDHYMAAQARLLAGQVEIRRDRFRFAEPALREAVRLDPKLVQAHRELILIYGFQLRRSELAGEFLVLSDLTELSFDDVFHWGMMQSEYLGAGRGDARCSCSASRPIPAIAGRRWPCAGDLRRVGSADQAEEALAGLATGRPRHNGGPRANRPRSQRRATCRAAPGDRCRPTIRWRPDSGAGSPWRGGMPRRPCTSTGSPTGSQPDSHDVLVGLITALAIQGKAESAAPLRPIAARRDRLHALLQRAVPKEHRDDPELPIRLGDACAAVHRDDEARGWYKLAIARNPLDSRAQHALFQLGAAAKKETRP